MVGLLRVLGVGSFSSVLMVVLVVSMSMQMGMVLGYEAESSSDLNLEFNGTHLTVPNEPPAQMFPEEDQSFEEMEREQPETDQPPEVEWFEDKKSESGLKDPLEGTVVREKTTQMSISQAQSAINAAVILSRYYADFFYRTKHIIPRTVAKAYVNAYFIIPLLTMLKYRRRFF